MKELKQELLEIDGAMGHLESKMEEYKDTYFCVATPANYLKWLKEYARSKGKANTWITQAHNKAWQILMHSQILMHNGA